MKRRFFCFGNLAALLPLGMFERKRYSESSTTCSTEGTPPLPSTPSDDEVISVIKWISVNDRLPEPQTWHDWGRGPSTKGLVSEKRSWNDVRFYHRPSVSYLFVSSNRLLLRRNHHIRLGIGKLQQLVREDQKWRRPIWIIGNDVSSEGQICDVTHWAEMPKLGEMHKVYEEFSMYDCSAHGIKFY